MSVFPVSLFVAERASTESHIVYIEFHRVEEKDWIQG
jgi:hypothetical protein